VREPVADELELVLDRDQQLADVVVQFARDTGTLLLLRADDAVR
jgi:hypothetical protein